MFCVGVQHGLRFCLHHLNYVKIAAFSVLFSIGETGKGRIGGDDSHVALGQKYPGEK
jgi:hypothetical protein